MADMAATIDTGTGRAMTDYPLHDEANTLIDASPEHLFAYLDDHARLGAHMEKRSMMMMGGRMTYLLDEAQGRVVGSVIKMGGSFLGIALEVAEIVAERDPPRRKVWQTQVRPRLLIIDRYRMGFEIAPVENQSRLRVFIDYERPSSLTGRLLGALFARLYARWCVSRMAEDAMQHFDKRVVPAA